jgi:hypothetical protein
MNFFGPRPWPPYAALSRASCSVRCCPTSARWPPSVWPPCSTPSLPGGRTASRDRPRVPRHRTLLALCASALPRWSRSRAGTGPCGRPRRQPSCCSMVCSARMVERALHTRTHSRWRSKHASSATWRFRGPTDAAQLRKLLERLKQAPPARSLPRAHSGLRSPVCDPRAPPATRAGRARPPTGSALAAYAAASPDARRAGNPGRTHLSIRRGRSRLLPDRNSLLLRHEP